MTAAQLASLFNTSAIAVVLCTSAWVAQRHPRPFFTHWVWAYALGALLMCIELVAGMTSRPWWLSLSEVALMTTSSWTYYEVGLLLRGRPTRPRLGAVCVLVVTLLAGVILAVGLPFPLALTPALLGFSLALVYVGAGIAFHLDAGSNPSTRRYLGISVALLGIVPLTYPLFERAGIDWIGFWISGLLHMLVGSSLIIYLLEETAWQLRDQNARLRELDQLKSQFLSTVSHELRTPLTSIVGYLELLEDGVGGRLADDQQEYVQNMQASAAHLSGLVDTILDSMRLQHGGLTIRREAVDVASRVHGAIETLRAVADRKEVALAAAPMDGLPLAAGDAVRVTQVLHNLVGNAIKFTPAGGRVTVEAEAQPLSRCLLVRVVDTGVGIPSDQIERVFEPFYQVDSSLTRSHGGTGLGLSIVREMVEAMGGEVGCESVLGSGSAFWFTLPLASDRVVAPASPAETAHRL